jgi:hypothetical protein
LLVNQVLLRALPSNRILREKLLAAVDVFIDRHPELLARRPSLAFGAPIGGATVTERLP